MDRKGKEINLAKLNSRISVEVSTLPVTAEPTLGATAVHVQFSSHYTRWLPWRTIPGGYSGIQVTGQNGGKNQTKKSQGLQTKPEKNPWTKFNLKTLFAQLRSRNSWELSRIFRLLWIPTKNPFLNQATQYLSKFSSPKISRNKKFQTQKTPSIIPVTWNPE